MTTTFHKPIKKTGSNMKTWNVDRDGQPFGQIWTFFGVGETHFFHAKTLNGTHQTFKYLRDAKDYMERVA